MQDRAILADSWDGKVEQWHVDLESVLCSCQLPVSGSFCLLPTTICPLMVCPSQLPTADH